MEKLTPSVRVSGGNPAGIPNFRPVNRLSRGELAALLRPPKPALFQVWVDARGFGRIPVGPRCPQPVALEFASAIRGQITLGRERTWSDPQVIAVGGLSQ